MGVSYKVLLRVNILWVGIIWQTSLSSHPQGHILPGSLTGKLTLMSQSRSTESSTLDFKQDGLLWCLGMLESISEETMHKGEAFKYALGCVLIERRTMASFLDERLANCILIEWFLMHLFRCALLFCMWENLTRYQECLNISYWHLVKKKMQ